MRPIQRFLLLAILLIPTVGATAQDLVVIVNPASGVRTLSRDEAANIFLGRLRRLPSGLPAMPIDIAEESVERARFYRWLVDKDLPQIDAYWSRLIYSGQTSPPLRVPDPATAVRLVAGNPNAIAYVDAAQVDAQVRVVLRLSSPQR